MPPKRIGPLTREEEERRVNKALLKATQLRHDVEIAIRQGTRATPFNRVQGRFLHVGGQRNKLQNADGTLTDAGRFYHELVGEDPP